AVRLVFPLRMRPVVRGAEALLQALGRPPPAGRPLDRAAPDLEGRRALLLGAAVLAEAGRRARDPSDTPHHADAHRHLPDRLHGAVRARARADALADDRLSTGGLPEVGNEQDRGRNGLLQAEGERSVNT